MTQTSKRSTPASTPAPAPHAPDPIERLEREFRTFALNQSRFKHQVNGNRLDKLALMVLGALTYCGPSRLTAIADRIGFDPSTVSRQVADLEKAELLIREVDPEDRRAILLKASERGRQLLLRLEAGRRKRIERTLTGWSAEDIGTLANLLGRLNEATEKHGEQNQLEVEQELNND